jgi:hypothetical protein
LKRDRPAAGGGAGRLDPDCPAVLLRGQSGVAGRDICLERFGERGVELADLVIDRDLFLVLRRGDLGEIEVVAYAMSSVLVPAKPRPTWALI